MVSSETDLLQVDGFLFLSGQIGLVPSSHLLSDATSLSIEASLALQHTKRIAEAFKSMHSSSNDLFAGGWVVWADCPGNLASVTRCWRNLQLIIGMSSPSMEHDVFIEWPESSPDMASPALFVVAKSLPKSAMIEVQLTLLQNDFDSETDSRKSFKLQSGASCY